MKDYIVKALAYNGAIRVYAARTTETVSEAQRRHDTWATASAALGRSLTASAMMGTMLKGEEKITVKIEGGGPIGHLIIDADAKGNVRGYVSNPHVHFDLNEHGKLDVARAVGKEGFLTVVKDIGMRDHFTGQVPIVSGELGEDFTYYFASSEQVPSSVGVGVLVNPDHSILAAGGFIIQVMPGADDEVISKIEQQLSSIEPVSKLIEKGLSPEELVRNVLGETEVKFLDTVPVKFQCKCSRERIENGLLSLGAQELQSIIEDEGKAEAVCHFCNEKYTFNKDELEEIKGQSNKGN
ncbi:redox-regulated molecular chaperone Hsp33 [Lottiidibacillus patelloidae]|uniref:33 kDa chaperonin n=1 Tax=Lottiidibacillus patelloidae TaxID=2670334 RepID=A0A263BPY7_9BACI|nr:Hsp33 family molecular chaperone HslO [Lottiidibacillus patelloidae]OZM55825.1 redox-regulated molecular chaperone Hsp33 [Lottiidibacillus patelloidae]